jgi:hypothetical protein
MLVTSIKTNIARLARPTSYHSLAASARLFKADGPEPASAVRPDYNQATWLAIILEGSRRTTKHSFDDCWV